MIYKLKVLFAALVAYRHNIHMLHWKVVGPDFDCVHKLLDQYVGQFNTFIDEIAEMILSMGNNPLTIQECMELLDQCDSHVLIIESTEDYDTEKVYKALEIMFNDLYTLYNDISNDCDCSECNSKFDEHKYWLRVESKYKNVKRMRK